MDATPGLRKIDMLPSQEVTKHDKLFRLGFSVMRLGALCCKFSCLDRLECHRGCRFGVTVF